MLGIRCVHGRNTEPRGNRDATWVYTSATCKEQKNRRW
ncbi:MAG: hypothetical protein ACI8PZ_005177, partial [Myxococcota bacterium]